MLTGAYSATPRVLCPSGDIPAAVKSLSGKAGAVGSSLLTSDKGEQ